MIGGTLETGMERPTEEKVIISMDRHFVLKLMEIDKGVGCSRVAMKEGITNFLGNRSVVIFFDSGESEGLSLLCSVPFEDCWLIWLSRF